MKTTFDLPDQLVSELRRAARARGTTARSLVEESLRALLAEEHSVQQFALVDASVKGKGLRAEFEGATWAQLRDAAYGVPS